MCTLVVAWRVLEDAPVAVAANRDEAFDRPSNPPERLDRDGDPWIIAPRDERAGGTWIGYNEAGLFAGISNRWTDRDAPGGRSRGLLVLDALARWSAEEAASAVQDGLVAERYAPFNLLIADAESAILLEWDGELAVSNLEPGVHVVMNAGHDDDFRTVEGMADAVRRQARSARLIREALRPEPGETADGWQRRAEAALGDHEYGVCVHGDGFGTRSASTIARRADGSAVYRFADGPPCETAFHTVEGQS